MSRLVHAPFLTWVPVIGGATGAAVAAAAMASIRAGTLETAALVAGLYEVPDMGTLMTLAAIVVGSVCWALLYLIWGRGGLLDATKPRRPQIRRITVSRAVPAQWPVTPADVRVSPPRERSLPVDLNQPLSAFDPQSIPAVSFESIRLSGLRPSL